METSSHYPPAAVAEQETQEPPRVLVTITPRTIWVTAAVAAGVFVLFIVLLRALPALLLLFVAIILAEGIRPVVDALARAHIPRAIGVLLVYLVAAVLLVSLGWLLVQPLVDQGVELSNNLPTYVQQLQSFATSVQQAVGTNPDIQRFFAAAENQAAAELGDLARSALAIPLSALGVVFSVFVVLTMAFLWLTSVGRLRPFVLGLLPEGGQERTSAMLDELSRNLGGYARGIVVNMFIIGGLTGFGLFLLGVPYSLLLGVLAGLFEVIPFLGPWISGTVAVLVALAAGGPLKALEVFVLFQVIQQLEGNTVVPLVMSRAVKINPLTVILAILIGDSLLGIPGAVLAVPAAVVVQVVVRRLLAPLARRAANPPEEPAVMVPSAPQPQAPGPQVLA
jgi:predicted PurR-regulated permease PerM